MEVNPSELRQNIYNLLDQVIETGIPLEIKRKGHRLKIIPSKPTSKLANLQPNPECISGNPEDLVNIAWDTNWKPEL